MQNSEQLPLTNLEEQGAETFNSDDHSEVPPTDIVAFNELRSCADLFRMSQQRGVLELQPTFQRDVVWSPLEQTRFIDSLIKGLPIPSMCFAHDWKNNRYQVIDGLQRISTIVKFLNESEDWKLSKEDDIEPKIVGKKVSELRDGPNNLRKFYDRVENVSIPVTILRCEMSKTAHSEYVFTIFHRLNTGGSKLNNQEIRNCIFGGQFNKLLAELDQNGTWRSLNKMEPEKNYRFTKQEIILRLFALLDNHAKYGGRLSKFLNEYMKANRHPSDDFIAQKRQIFSRTVEVVYTKVFNATSPEKINISILEAILVGVAANLDFLESQTPEQVVAKYNLLLERHEFSPDRLKEGLSGKQRVAERIAATIAVFGPNAL